MLVQDKVAIVTGAGRGLGAAIGHVLAQEGARVVVCDIEGELVNGVASEIQKDGGTARALTVDVSQVAELDGLVQTPLQEFGRVDILVNNAGICPRTPIDEMTEEMYDRIMDINLKSVFFLTRAAGNAMKPNNWGRIVNVSSTDGRTGGIFNATVYSATKAGIMSMTKAFARHYAPYNILVNCVAPGTVDTRLMRNISQASLEASINSVPLKRLADPAEIAQVITFLASDRQTYMTGAIVDVNGGAVMP